MFIKCKFIDKSFVYFIKAIEQGEEPPVTTQPTKLESFFALTKSLIIRALIIYFVSSFLRKPASTPEVSPNVPDGAPTPSRLPATNLLQNGTLFDLHVYISEDQFNVNFSDTNSLIWYQEGLTYGDWYGGRNGDGSITHHTKIHASEQLQVLSFPIFRLK